MLRQIFHFALTALLLPLCGLASSVYNYAGNPFTGCSHTSGTDCSGMTSITIQIVTTAPLASQL
jgi:hypothetical protein